MSSGFGRTYTKCASRWNNFDKFRFKKNLFEVHDLTLRGVEINEKTVIFFGKILILINTHRVRSGQCVFIKAKRKRNIKLSGVLILM